MQVDGEPERLILPRVTRTIQALLSKRTAGAGPLGRRATIPGTLRFLDLLVVGDEGRFVERTVRVAELPPAEAAPARAGILAAIPPRTGRVT